MSMIFHLVDCLNHLGFDIKTELIVNLHEIVDYSFLLTVVAIAVKNGKNKKFLNRLEAKLKNMYIEKRDTIASCKVDTFLAVIWEQIGISMEDDALYPFRNAMIAELLKQQNSIYDEVIHELCHFLIMTRSSKAEKAISMTYIQMLLLPSLFHTASMKYDGIDSSKSDLMFMKKLSAVIKLAADLLKKRETSQN